MATLILPMIKTNFKINVSFIHLLNVMHLNVIILNLCAAAILLYFMQFSSFHVVLAFGSLYYSPKIVILDRPSFLSYSFAF